MTKVNKKEILDFIEELKKKDVSANVAAQLVGQLYTSELNNKLKLALSNINGKGE